MTRQNFHDLMTDLESFDQSPDGRGFDLRLDLADIILRHLNKNGITQKKLAELAGMKEPMITRLIHAATNCTFDSAGRILFALGIKGRLVELQASAGGMPMARKKKSSHNTPA
jgi:plasmid maintenance system antidote protein VapI